MKKEIKINLSKQMKIIIAAGVALLVVVVGLKMMSPSHAVSAAPPSTATPTPTSTPLNAPGSTTTTAHHKGAPPVDLLPGLPAALKSALTAHGVVVAVVYGAGDEAAVKSARQGAHSAHVGFAALDVGHELVAQAVETFAPSTADPTVLVIRRPGTVTTVLPGYSDADTVAQAAAQPVVPPATTVPATTTPTP